MIIRSPRKESNFTIVANSVVRDARLSFRARGILLDILSRPDNWTISAESLARGGKEGRDAVLTALNELRANGYLITSKKQLEDGKFVTESMVYDIPQFIEPTPEKPTPGKPTPGKPKSDNQGSLEGLTKKNLDIYIDSLFQEFWDTYPIHNGGRANSEKAWAKAVKKATPLAIIEGAQRYRDDLNRQKEFTAYPATWLNQQRWDDPPLPPQSLKTGQRNTSPTTVPPKFDPKEFVKIPLNPEKVAEIRKLNGV